MTTAQLRVIVNGAVHEVGANPSTSLLQVLRGVIGLNGPKYGCGLGECGACLVLIDGKAARSCVLPLSAVLDQEVTTLEGLATTGGLHVVQQAFIEAEGTQCGYCLNGMIMRTVALLKVVPHPTEPQIREALRYNLCRCGAHEEILASVRRAVALTTQPPRKTQRQ